MLSEAQLTAAAWLQAIPQSQACAPARLQIDDMLADRLPMHADLNLDANVTLLGIIFDEDGNLASNTR